jgi:hypothetical protein
MREATDEWLARQLAETVLLAGGPIDRELTFLHLPHEEEDAVLRGPRYVRSLGPPATMSFHRAIGH